MIVSENQRLIIVLTTVIPVSLIVIVAIVLCRRARRRRHRHFLFNRGITPIDDEEIESWKIDRSDEKRQVVERAAPVPATPVTPVTPMAAPTPTLAPAPASPPAAPSSPAPTQQHQSTTSVTSIRKPPSVIVYHNPRVSDELASPTRSLYHKRSIDVPAAQVLARAPNARPGLTDESVQGDAAFIKRQPSRLAKPPPASPRSPLVSAHHRTRSSRSSSMSAYWHGHFSDFQFTSPRESSEFLPRTNRSLDIRPHARMHSQSLTPRLSFDEDVFLEGLTPRPLIHQSEIGRAIG